MWPWSSLRSWRWLLGLLKKKAQILHVCPLLKKTLRVLESSSSWTQRALSLTLFFWLPAQTRLLYLGLLIAPLGRSRFGANGKPIAQLLKPFTLRGSDELCITKKGCLPSSISFYERLKKWSTNFQDDYLFFVHCSTQWKMLVFFCWIGYCPFQVGGGSEVWGRLRKVDRSRSDSNPIDDLQERKG